MRLIFYTACLVTVEKRVITPSAMSPMVPDLLNCVNKTSTSTPKPILAVFYELTIKYVGALNMNPPFDISPVGPQEGRLRYMCRSLRRDSPDHVA